MNEDLYYTGKDTTFTQVNKIQLNVDTKKNNIWKRISEIFKFIFIGKMEFEL